MRTRGRAGLRTRRRDPRRRPTFPRRRAPPRIGAAATWRRRPHHRHRPWRRRSSRGRAAATTRGSARAAAAAAGPPPGPPAPPDGPRAPPRPKDRAARLAAELDGMMRSLIRPRPRRHGPPRRPSPRRLAHRPRRRPHPTRRRRRARRRGFEPRRAPPREFQHDDDQIKRLRRVRTGCAPPRRSSSKRQGAPRGSPSWRTRESRAGPRACWPHEVLAALGSGATTGGVRGCASRRCSTPRTPSCLGPVYGRTG